LNGHDESFGMGHDESIFGMGMMNPYGNGGGFYDPFWNPGFGFNRAFGFRHSFNMSSNGNFGFGNFL